mmetsp:Transcript_31706/g.66463  ORF Transcript_31706/g.66463 Transcript_31706/m.66463 type:complete len:128 (-) Transcript_31706:1075-1458(-)
MIDYFKGVYGLNLLGRIHGSSLYKGSLMGLLSVAVYLVIALLWANHRRDGEEDLDHPYGVGVLVSSVSFLITFRANYGYQRYWEACVSSNLESGSVFLFSWREGGRRLERGGRCRRIGLFLLKLAGS